MNRVWKERWLRALRSGEYSQGSGRLRGTESEFCCLGVICDLVSSSTWTLHPSKECFTFEGEIGLPPRTILRGLGLSKEEAKSLARMNDNGASFKQIAMHIEVHF